MSVFRRTIRMSGLVVAGVLSLVTAMMLGERIIQPGTVETLGTPALLGLVLMFVLPAVTGLALRHDRLQAMRLSQDEATIESLEDAVRAATEGELRLPALPNRTVRHDPHARPPAMIAGRSSDATGPVHDSDRARDGAALG